jgi:hypothetical protein
MADVKSGTVARSWNWWRAYHGLPFDSKLAVIAKRCGARRGDVAAVWVALLDCASQHVDRGSVVEIDPEEIAVSFDYEVEYVSKILAAFEEKGMIAGGRLTAWERRQPQREREDSSAARTRDYRQRLKNLAHSPSVTPCDPNVTPYDNREHQETLCDAPEKRRLEKNIEDRHTEDRRDFPACISLKASDLNGTVSPRFEEFWDRYPRKQHKDAAGMAWVSAVTAENDAAVFACLDRYLSSDEVSRNVVMNPEKWLYEQSRDGFTGDWQMPVRQGIWKWA